jgi:Tfp pilus assembly protein PilF
VRLGALRGLDAVAPEERWTLASPLLRDPVRSVRIEAASFLADVAMDGLGANDRMLLQRALDEYIDVQNFNVSRPEARLNLGLLYMRRGDAQQAETEYRAAIGLDRYFIPAYVNLADLYRVQGRDADGKRLLHDALVLAPDNAPVQHALGLLLVRAQQTEEALVWLRRSAASAPDNARYAYVYGVALGSAGHTGKALEILAAAQRRHAADRNLLYTLVTMNRDAGRMAEARRYAAQLAELAPDDPFVTRMLDELGRQ